MGEINKNTINIAAGNVDVNLLKDSMGRFRTRSLFVETCSVGDTPLYTLRDEDYEGYMSAYKIYSTADTEYFASINLVGSQRHWSRLVDCDWFMTGILDGRAITGFDGLSKWREESEERLKAFNIHILIALAKEGNINAVKALLGLSDKETKKPKLRKKDSKEAEDFFHGKQNLFEVAKRLS